MKTTKEKCEVIIQSGYRKGRKCGRKQCRYHRKVFSTLSENRYGIITDIMLVSLYGMYVLYHLV
jgi:hypothetical protein